MQSKTNLPVTVKTRIGYDQVEDYEHLHNFIKLLKATGVKTFIIHARKAMLGKFTPKQNLNIPPLKYDHHRCYRHFSIHNLALYYFL